MRRLLVIKMHSVKTEEDHLTVSDNALSLIYDVRFSSAQRACCPDWMNAVWCL